MCVLCGPNRAQMVVDHTITHPFALEPETDYMCSECGEHVAKHPDKMEFLAKHQMDTIIRVGHQVMNIFGGDEPAFSYTVGRTMKDRPELLITGNLPDDIRTSILNGAAIRDDETPLEPGVRTDILGDNVPVRIVAVDPREAMMFAATDAFGDDVTALQIIWPDSAGRFPDEGWEYGPGAAPVYGSLP